MMIDEETCSAASVSQPGAYACLPDVLVAGPCKKGFPEGGYLRPGARFNLNQD